LREVVDNWWTARGKNLTRRELVQDQDPFQSAFENLDQNMKQVYAKKGMRADVNKMARLTVTKAHSDLKEEINSYVGYDPMLNNKKSRKLAQKTIQESTSYIKSIPQEYHRDVKRTVYDGIRKGKTINEIASDLSGVYEKAGGRTKTIAMDQTGNLRGAITKAQHQAIGLKKFNWLTVGDNRVRPRHVAFGGEIFSWSEGANGEFPGSAIGCRCTASTVKSEVQEVFAYS